MNRIQRLTLEAVVALFVIGLLCTVMPDAKAEPVSTLTNDPVLIDLTSTNTSLQRAILSLGVALIGGTLIFRRKTS